jgi:hypothetical protein
MAACCEKVLELTVFRHLFKIMAKFEIHWGDVALLPP